MLIDWDFSLSSVSDTLFVMGDYGFDSLSLLFSYVLFFYKITPLESFCFFLIYYSGLCSFLFFLTITLYPSYSWERRGNLENRKYILHEIMPHILSILSILFLLYVQAQHILCVWKNKWRSRGGSIVIQSTIPTSNTCCPSTPRANSCMRNSRMA